MKEEGGCPFTKMCKLAGTPHVGAILIVLFVIAGGVYFLMLNCEGTPTVGNTVKPLNALNEKEEIENGLKKFHQAPSGYIKITNIPEGSPGGEAKGKYPFFVRSEQIEFTGTPEDPGFRVVGPQYKQIPSTPLPPDYVPNAAPEAVPTLTDQVLLK